MTHTMKRFVVAATVAVIVIGFSLWVITQIYPTLLPSWMDKAFLILGGLGALLVVAAAVYADLLLPILDRSTSKAKESFRDLMRLEAPIRSVTVEELTDRLGSGGPIPYVNRGVTNAQSLVRTNRLAILGSVKSGKTREAIELMRQTQDRGEIVSIYEPTSSLDLIDLDMLKQIVVGQMTRQSLLFFIDELDLRQTDQNLSRLSLCIEAIQETRPDALFLVTLQVERLTATLQGWLHKNDFGFVIMQPLTRDERFSLVERTRKTLGVAVTDAGAQLLSESDQVSKPWDIVSVLQYAPLVGSSDPAMNEVQMQRLLSDSQAAIWERQRNEVISTQPVSGTLLEAIALLFSAGVTPSESMAHQYVEYLLLPRVSHREIQRQITDASHRWHRFDIVAVNGRYVIPEPRLIPLLIDPEDARQQLIQFAASYRPGLGTAILVLFLRPFQYIARLRQLHGRYLNLRGNRVRSRFPRTSRQVHSGGWSQLGPVRSFLLRLSSSSMRWVADKELLVRQLGSKTLKNDYLYSQAFLTNAQEHIRNGQYETALADIDRAHAVHPKNTNVIYQRGITHYSMEQYEQALLDFTECINLNAKHVSAFIWCGIIRGVLERHSEAIADFDTAIELNPQEEWAFLRRSIVYRDMGLFEMALADCNTAIDSNPYRAWAFVRRSIVYLDLDQYGVALQDLNKAVNLESSLAWSFFWRSIIYRDMEWYEEALMDSDRVISLFAGENASLFAGRGISYTDPVQYERALSDLHVTIDLDRNHAWTFLWHGIFLRYLERYDDALADFSRAIKLKPESSEAFAQRAITYMLVGKYNNALAGFDEAIRLNRDNADWYFWRFLVRHRLRQIDNARQDMTQSLAIIEKALIADPMNWHHRARRALFGVFVDDTDTALQRYRDLLSEGPSTRVLCEARDDLQLLVSLFPEDTASSYSLKLVQEYLGKRIDIHTPRII